MNRIILLFIFSSLLLDCDGDNSSSPKPEIINFTYSPVRVFPSRPDRHSEDITVTLVVEDKESDAWYILVETGHDKHTFVIKEWNNNQSTIEFSFRVDFEVPNTSHTFMVSVVDYEKNISNKLSAEILVGEYIEDVSGMYRMGLNSFKITSIEYPKGSCSSLETGVYEIDVSSFYTSSPSSCDVGRFEALSPSGRKISMQRMLYPIVPCEGDPPYDISVNFLEPGYWWILDDPNFGRFDIEFQSEEEFLIKSGGSFCPSK